MSITAEQREAAYLARRIIRATPHGVTHKKLLKSASTLTLRLVEVLPLYMQKHCLAKPGPSA